MTADGALGPVFAALSDVAMPLAWIAVAAFLVAVLLEAAERRDLAVPVAAAAWGVFGVFWLAMFPYFYLDVRSPLEAILSLAALPLCLYAGYLLTTGRDSLLVLSRAVAFMGVLYLPLTTVEPAKAWLIETVAIQTHWGMELVGYSPGLAEGPEGYRSMFDFEGYTTYIVLACTGIGSISIFGGLIAAVQAPLRRKAATFATVTGIVWVLNIGRNVFVGLAAPLGWFDYSMLAQVTATLAGPDMNTSFFVSHHLISQSLSVVALVALALLVVRLLPEVVEPLEEALYVVTGTEYDLGEAIGTRATDGG